MAEINTLPFRVFINALKSELYKLAEIERKTDSSSGFIIGENIPMKREKSSLLSD
jgi:hypothetical protein